MLKDLSRMFVNKFYAWVMYAALLIIITLNVVFECSTDNVKDVDYKSGVDDDFIYNQIQPSCKDKKRECRRLIRSITMYTTKANFMAMSECLLELETLACDKELSEVVIELDIHIEILEEYEKEVKEKVKNETPIDR